MQKMVYTNYTNLILPKKPEEISFEETIKILPGIFLEGQFHTRYKYLNIVKQENEDCDLCKQSELLRLGDLSISMFKCLIFVQ